MKEGWYPFLGFHGLPKPSSMLLEKLPLHVHQRCLGCSPRELHWGCLCMPSVLASGHMVIPTHLLTCMPLTVRPRPQADDELHAKNCWLHCFPDEVHTALTGNTPQHQSALCPLPVDQLFAVSFPGGHKCATDLCGHNAGCRACEVIGDKHNLYASGPIVCLPKTRHWMPLTRSWPPNPLKVEHINCSSFASC